MKFTPEDSIAFVLHKTDLKLTNYLAGKLKPYDVTPEQWGVLGRLWLQDGISQKELSKLTTKDETTITRIIDKMELKRLVKRRVNQGDRRVFLIYLTQKGRDLEGKLAPLVEEVLDEALQGISSSVARVLINLLNKICENVDKGSL